jgi:3-oxochol-4-en-24-oyl-CoA dehydrogenase
MPAPGPRRIGFTWEHDAHLYLRRALALRQLLRGGAAWRERTAALALAGSRRRLALTAPGLPLAGVARAVADTVAALPPEHRRAALADAGYVAPQWPPPYGLGASPGEVSIIDEKLDRAGLTRPHLVIGGWAGLAVVQHGSPAQQERFAGPTLRGEITRCQLSSEPGAGSDLASLQTRARRVAGAGAEGTSDAGTGRRVAGGGWRLAGQKVWTSLAREADWAICLARTDPAGPCSTRSFSTRCSSLMTACSESPGTAGGSPAARWPSASLAGLGVPDREDPRG